MTPDDRPDMDETVAARLVDALRAEIVDLEFESDVEDAPLPAGILALLRDAPVPSKIAAAVDEVVSNVEPVSDSLAARLRAELALAQAERGTGIEFLEQAASHERLRRGVTLEQLAAKIGVDADVAAKVEEGRTAFDSLEDQQVADWIRFLELDLEDAVAALEHSLNAPASSYAGDMREHKKTVNDFVERVRRILEAGK